jgi:hypothetical protein
MMQAHELVRLKSELEIAQRLQQVLDSKIYKKIPGGGGISELAKYLGIPRSALYRNQDKIGRLKNEITEHEKAMRI